MAKKTGAGSFTEAQDRAKTLKARSSARDGQIDESSAAYWLESAAQTERGRDPKSLKQVISPTPRNMVVGAVRLLTATDPVFSVEADGPGKDKIETLAKKIWSVSSSVKMAKIHVDAARSAVLWSDVHLIAKCLDDMLKVKGIPPARKNRLQRIAEQTPYLIECIPPKGGYAELDDDSGLIAYLRVYTTTGSKLTSEYGRNDLSAEQPYIVNDWYDEIFRYVWIEGESKTLIEGAHGLDEIPVSVMFSDGTGLFPEEEKKRQPFLYSYLKSGQWELETSVLTAFFTSMFDRGAGPLVAIDPEGLGGGGVEVHFSGGLRYLIGKAQLLDDKVFDINLTRAMDMLSGMAAESTMYPQALGAPVGGSQTAFSTVSLLSQAGRLPMTAPSEAVSAAIGQIMSIIMRRCKKDGIASAFIKSSDIPDKFTLTARLDVKLPQDQLRNAQIGKTLTQGDNPLVSNEYVRQEVMGINDSTAMDRQIVKEKYQALRFVQIAQQVMAQMNQTPPTITSTGGTTTPPTGGVSPDMAAAGAEQPPATEPMQPGGTGNPPQQPGGQ
jgi:hypothetical protein